MKKYLSIPLFIFIIACSYDKDVYWCGDHPCINNKEKEAYFEKTMIVEVRNYNKNKIKNVSEIEKILNQAKLDEKKRILTEKELVKKTKKEEKELAKQLRLEEKKRIKEEKELAKQLRLEEKKRIKEERELAKQLKLDEKKRIKEKNKIRKVVKLEKKKSNKKKMIKVVSRAENLEISSHKFEGLVKKIMERNSSRPYPEINDIQK